MQYDFYKIPEISDRFRRNLIFPYRFFRNFQVLIFMTVRQAEEGMLQS
jgi:hypothetical protein